MPLTPGKGPEQGTIQSSAERGPREVKQYPITVDGERTFYPENYPHQFIVDGPPASIRRIMGGIDGDRSKLGPAINAYLRPSQEVFSNTLPDWYNQTLAPILERMHLSLDDLKPDDLRILGDGFRGALDTVYDFPFPKDVQVQAARDMGQTEGTVPTLSELMKTLKEADLQKYINLFEQLVAKGRDGFVMGAYLAAPEEEKAVKPEETEPELDFDKLVRRDEAGRVHINQQALRDFYSTTWKGLREGFDKGVGDVDFTPSDKIVHPENYKLNEPKSEE